jgi:CheY-like chemotaxis protein
MTTWMVVEDEPDLYELVLVMYGMLGVDGIAFTNGEDAVAWIEEADNGQYDGEMPELALLDIRLPGQVSGLDVSARIRQSNSLSQLPVILMTAYRVSQKEEKRMMKESSADLLLYKPFPKLQDFQKIVQKVLS